MTARIDPIEPKLRWDVLSPSELERIHDATLEVLEEDGGALPQRARPGRPRERRLSRGRGDTDRPLPPDPRDGGGRPGA